MCSKWTSALSSRVQRSRLSLHQRAPVKQNVHMLAYYICSTEVSVICCIYHFLYSKAAGLVLNSSC